MEKVLEGDAGSEIDAQGEENRVLDQDKVKNGIKAVFDAASELELTIAEMIQVVNSISHALEAQYPDVCRILGELKEYKGSEQEGSPA